MAQIKPFAEVTLKAKLKRHGMRPAERLAWMQTVVAREPHPDRRVKGIPLLTHAVRCEWLETVEWLLEQGADPNACIEGHEGRSLGYGVLQHTQMPEHNWGDQDTAPEREARHRTRRAILDALHAHGVDPLLGAAQGQTLWEAAAGHNEALCEWLVAQRYPVNLPDRQGRAWAHWLALHWDLNSAEARRTQQCQLQQALALGADLTQCDHDGRTPDELLAMGVMDWADTAVEPQFEAAWHDWRAVVDGMALAQHLEQALSPPAPSSPSRPRL